MRGRDGTGPQNGLCDQRVELVVRCAGVPAERIV